MSLKSLHIDGETLCGQAALQSCLCIWVAHQCVQQRPLYTCI